jgi:hypothetical protein
VASTGFKPSVWKAPCGACALILGPKGRGTSRFSIVGDRCRWCYATNLNPATRLSQLLRPTWGRSEIDERRNAVSDYGIAPSRSARIALTVTSDRGWRQASQRVYAVSSTRLATLVEFPTGGREVAPVDREETSERRAFPEACG